MPASTLCGRFQSINQSIMFSHSFIHAMSNRVRYWSGRVPYFNQSEARKKCFTVSDLLKYGTLPHQ